MVRAVDQTPVPYSPDREWFTPAVTVTPTLPPKPADKPADETTGTEAGTATAPPADDAAAQEEATGQLIGILISGSLPRTTPSFKLCVCAEAAVAASAHTHHGRSWGLLGEIGGSWGDGGAENARR